MEFIKDNKDVNEKLYDDLIYSLESLEHIDEYIKNATKLKNFKKELNKTNLINKSKAKYINDILFHLDIENPLSLENYTVLETSVNVDRTKSILDSKLEQLKTSFKNVIYSSIKFFKELDIDILFTCRNFSIIMFLSQNTKVKFIFDDKVITTDLINEDLSKLYEYSYSCNTIKTNKSNKILINYIESFYKKLYDYNNVNVLKEHEKELIFKFLVLVRDFNYDFYNNIDSYKEVNIPESIFLNNKLQKINLKESNYSISLLDCQILNYIMNNLKENEKIKMILKNKLKNIIDYYLRKLESLKDVNNKNDLINIDLDVTYINKIKDLIYLFRALNKLFA